MGMKQYKKGVKKRREERLRLLKEKQRKMSGTAYPPGPRTYAQDESSYFPSYGEAEREYKKHRRSEVQISSLFVKVACAFLLVAGTFMIMNADNPELQNAQSFVTDVMHRDFNVQGVMNWYEETVGAAPDFLPQVIQRNEIGEEPENEYVLPVSGGTVITAFGQNEDGITLETNATLPIEVVKEGWVTSVGEKEGHGLTVVIDHGDQEESWYGNVQDLRVQLHDWVDQGEVIGSTGVNDQGEATFYFALKKDSVFIDPLDVISFD